MIGAHSGESNDALPVNFFNIGEPHNVWGIKKHFEIYRDCPFGSTYYEAHTIMILTFFIRYVYIMLYRIFSSRYEYGSCITTN